MLRELKRVVVEKDKKAFKGRCKFRLIECKQAQLRLFGFVLLLKRPKIISMPPNMCYPPMCYPPSMCCPPSMCYPPMCRKTKTQTVRYLKIW